MTELKFERKWTIWEDCPDYHETYEETKNAVKWVRNIRKIYTFETIPNFWGAYNNTEKVSDISYKSSYFIFVKNIKPVWYDLYNLNGGEIKFTLDKKVLINKKISINDIWMFFVLSLIGENLDNSENINGISILNLKDYYKVSIWVSECNNEMNNNILLNLKKILESQIENLEIGIEGISFFPNYNKF